MDNKPETIKAVETRYCCISPVRLAPAAPLSRIGGVMIPASMARACWNPSNRAKSVGIRSFKPKKGAALRLFLMNGKFGVKRKA